VERIEEPYFESLAPVRLYRDDIDNIHQKLAAACEEVTILIGGFSFTEPAKLSELNQEVLFDIEFRGRNPTVHADLKHNTAHLFASSNDALSRGIIATVKDAIPTKISLRLWNMLAFFSSLISLVIFLMSFFINTTVPMIPFAIIMILLAFVYPFWYWRTEFARHTIVYLKYRKDAPSFLKRNKDALIVNLFVAVVAIVLGWLLANYQGQSPVSVPSNPITADSTPVGR
jgi:hypothetical protein